MSSSARVDTDPRISRRRRAVSRSRHRRLLLRAALAGTLALGVWTAFWSPLLKIDSVRVVGGKHTSAVDVAEVAGLDSGDNLLLVSTASVERAVETLPWVRHADVDRKLPGTIKVRVVERKPVMILQTGQSQWTIDARGHVLTAGRAGADLVTLGGVTIDSIEPGVQLTDEAVRAALRTWRSLGHSLRARVEGIFAPTAQRLTLALNGDVLVRYGSADRLDAKAAVLKAVLARVARDGRPIAYIDVRVPTSPAIQPFVAPPPVPEPAAETSAAEAATSGARER